MVATNIQNEVAGAFGRVAPGRDANPYPPQKENLLLFRKNRIYLSLDLKSTYDQKKGEYLDPVPRLTASFDGTFVNMPADSKVLKEFAGFLVKMADALDGIVIENSAINDDVANAKKALQRFRTAA